MSSHRQKRMLTRVLIVDDDTDWLNSFSALFKEMHPDCAVETAVDGNTAVVLWEKHKPELVILDMMLPKRSGFLVLERIRDGGDPKPFIVMITANEGKRHQAYAEALGVDCYYHKVPPRDGSQSIVEYVYGRMMECVRHGFDLSGVPEA